MVSVAAEQQVREEKSQTLTEYPWPWENDNWRDWLKHSTIDIKWMQAWLIIDDNNDP